MKHRKAGQHNNPHRCDILVIHGHSPKRSDNSITHCDREGTRPESVLAGIQLRPEERQIVDIGRFIDIQADYRALISMLESIPDGGVARFDTPFHMMWSQLVGLDRVHDRDTSQLLSQVNALIKEKHLTIDLHWAPRQLELPWETRVEPHERGPQH